MKGVGVGRASEAPDAAWGHKAGREQGISDNRREPSRWPEALHGESGGKKAASACGSLRAHSASGAAPGSSRPRESGDDRVHEEEGPVAWRNLKWLQKCLLVSGCPGVEGNEPREECTWSSRERERR